MPAPVSSAIVVLNPSEGQVEKARFAADNVEALKDGVLVLDTEIKKPIHPLNDGGDHDQDSGSEDVIIITGADAAAHLLPLRDDGEPALTFRSLFLATILSAFQAVMNQIYYVS
jgi:hypothetical protein